MCFIGVVVQAMNILCVELIGRHQKHGVNGSSISRTNIALYFTLNIIPYCVYRAAYGVLEYSVWKCIHCGLERDIEAPKCGAFDRNKAAEPDVK